MASPTASMVTVIKKSFPIFLAVLLVTSQCSGVWATAAEEECCSCDETSSLLAAAVAGAASYFGGPLVSNLLGAGPGGIAKDSMAAKLMQASAKSGLGSKVVSTVQQMGTATGARRAASEMAGEAYRAARNRCCPCKAKSEL